MSGVEDYRADIDGLRAVAVLSVIGFHYFPGLFPGGFIGVDVFFVVSGFLISRIIFRELESRRFSLFGFYGRRIRRIFPALIIVLAACLAVGWGHLLPPQFAALGKHALGGASFSSNFLLWKESGYFDASAITKPLLHLWSLGVEEQFYLLYPALMWAASKRRIPPIIAVSVLGLASFVLNATSVHGDRAMDFYSPQTRFWELMVGAAMAALPKEQSGAFSSDAHSAAGILMLGMGVFLLDKNSEFPGWLALLPVVGAALLISSGQHAWVNRSLLSRRLMVWIGLISFPLYLWHWPLLSFAHLLTYQEPSVPLRLALLALSILLAWLVYALVERPIRRSRFPELSAWILLGALGGVGWVGARAWDGACIPPAGRAEAQLPGPSPAPPLNTAALAPAKPRPTIRSERRAKKAVRAPEAPDASNGASVSPVPAAVALTSAAMTLAEWTYYFDLYRFTLANDLKTVWRQDCNFYDVDAYWAGKATSLPKEISPTCVERTKGKKHLAFLWGDSHASQLYGGLKKHLPSDWELLIVATSMCAPAMVTEDSPQKFCGHSNWVALNAIRDLRPDVVLVVQDTWHNVGLAETFGKAMKEAGVGRTIYVGPAPAWTGSLPDIVAQKLWESTPKRTLQYNDENKKVVDAVLADGLKGSPYVEYFDLLRCFCDENGCLVYLGEDRLKGLTSHDGHHLTPAAADYLAENFLVKAIVGKRKH